MDDSGSYDPDGDPQSYEWRWSGGLKKRVDSILKFSPGVTTVTLAVSDYKQYGYDTVEMMVAPTDPNTWITE
jgi:hypothetical protein